MLLHTNNEQSKKEIKKSIPLIIASKRTKHLGINLVKKVKELYTGNYKILLKLKMTPIYGKAPVFTDWTI